MRFFYRLFWYLAWAIVPLYLRLRLNRHKEDKAYIGERYGLARHKHTVFSSKARLVWIHAASVGEVNSIVPLIKYIRHRYGKAYDFLLTTSSRNGQTIAEKSLPSYVALQYLPLDHPLYAKRFIGHYRPDAALWVEQELWPNLLYEARRQGVRLALINGRLTEKSLRRWRLVSGFAAGLGGLFDRVWAQSPKDADNFKSLKFDAEYIGNLKALSPATRGDGGREKSADKKATPNIRAILPKSRRLWLAASLHLGEEALCYEAHKIVKRQAQKDLFLLLVPRYPLEARRMQATAGRYGLQAELYSELTESPRKSQKSHNDCLIIDAFGLLSALYEVCDVAFLGGSSGADILGYDCGGHNPLEAVRKDCISLVGYDMRNFSYISDELAAGGSLLFTEARPDDLARVLKRVLIDEALRKKALRGGKPALAKLSRQAEASADEICRWLGVP